MDQSCVTLATKIDLPKFAKENVKILKLSVQEVCFFLSDPCLPKGVYPKD